MILKKLIYGEMLSEEECYRKHEKLVFVGLKTLLPIARKLNVDPEDLISEGRIGLIRAYRYFDETLGYQFTTYAIKTIKGAGLRYIRDKSKSIHYSRSILELAYNIRKNDLVNVPRREIAKQFNVPLKLVDAAFISMQGVHSLEKKVTDEDSATLHELIGKEADYSEVYVRHFITGLNERQRKVIELRLNGKSQSEIGKVIGVSQIQVSRILKQIGQKYVAM